MIKWFKGCNNSESVKKRYRDLCKQYHPDLHPGEESEAAMKEINAEYDVVWARYKNVHSTAGTSEGKESSNNESRRTSDYSSEETPEGFKAIINAIIGCEGIDIDLVGRWVWVTGNTYPHRDTLKKNGFQWAAKKQAWYWHPADEQRKRHSRMSLDEIKDRYGCQSFSGNHTPRLTN